MHADVPQFIDVEDKIAGPLTWHQLFWMIGLLVVLIVLYNIFTAGVFIALAIPISIIFVVFAFMKPYGQSMSSFVFYGVMHIFGPKIYVWRREFQPKEKLDPPKRKIPKKTLASELDLKEIESLANILDGK